jgi:energy-coupling factor transporter ATP-binding protein EcfA2
VITEPEDLTGRSGSAGGAEGAPILATAEMTNAAEEGVARADDPQVESRQAAFAAIDRRWSELLAAADPAPAFDSDTEDAVLPGMLSSALSALVRERRQEGQELQVDRGNGPRPRVHARLRLLVSEETEDELHWSFRGIAARHHRAVQPRFRDAVEESGIMVGGPARVLVLLRRHPWPTGRVTTEVVAGFRTAGGQELPLTEDDARTMVALQGLLRENPPQLDVWLAERRPACGIDLFREILGGRLPLPLAESEHPKPEGNRRTSSAGGARRSPGPAPPAILTLGTTLRDHKPFDVALELLRKHVLVVAGSGAGKTVLLKRLVEEAALLGVSSVVLDPNNDLSRLGRPWPQDPDGWDDGDERKAREYFAVADVVVWAPRRTAGRPLSFEAPGQTQARPRYPGFVVIAGRNGSGKSTFLRSIAAGLAGPDATYVLAETDRDWVSRGSTHGRVHLELTADGGTLASRVTESAPLSAGLAWPRPDGVRTRPQPDRHPDRRPSRRVERELWAARPRGWFCAGYGPFRRLAGTGGEVTRLMAGDYAIARFATLFREEASLSETVQWLQQINYRAATGQPGYRDLEITVLALLNDGLLPDGHRAERVDPDGLWVTHPSGASVRIQEMSDGYRSITALIVDVVRQIHECFEGDVEWLPERLPRPAAAGIVLIDEIDAHLHVTWQKAIGPWLCDHFPHVQFIVTTHSPYVCQSASPGGLIRLAAPVEEAGPQVLDEELYQRVAHGTGDDGVLSELFGLDSPYSSRSEALRRRLTELEAAALRGHADDAQLDELEALVEQITPSPASRAHDALREP